MMASSLNELFDGADANVHPKKKLLYTIFSYNSGQVVLGLLSRLRWVVLDTLLETTRKGSTLHQMFHGVTYIFAAESEFSIIQMLWNL